LPGIACVLAVLLLGAFDFWFWYGLKETWDSWDKQMENGSWSMGARVWVVFMTCLVAWKCLKFAHKRLVLNPIRPETEK
jgi:hypothetical protein